MKALLIVNPVSQVNKGAQIGRKASALLRDTYAIECTYVETLAPRHATDLAAASGDYDTVIALGGDGVIHEVANGLMKISSTQRPSLAIIPVGSGNDFAKTLNVSTKYEEACSVIAQNKTRLQDVGICNGEYFVETVSFGLDAAIAIDTYQRRLNTKKTGNALYMESGLNQLLFHRDTYHYNGCVDGVEKCGSTLLFAVQLGKTYGGGFQVCPNADPTDGVFDVCLAKAPLGLVKATSLFLSAKNGKHVGNKELEFFNCKQLSLEFDRIIPAQMDGEDCTAQAFKIEILPKELSVVYA